MLGFESVPSEIRGAWAGARVLQPRAPGLPGRPGGKAAHGNATVFPSSRFLGVPGNTATPTCGQRAGWGASSAGSGRRTSPSPRLTSLPRSSPRGRQGVWPVATVPASEATRGPAHAAWPWARCPASPQRRRGHPPASPLEAEVASPRGPALLRPVAHRTPQLGAGGAPSAHARGAQGPKVGRPQHELCWCQQTHVAAVGTRRAGPHGKVGGAAQSPAQPSPTQGGLVGHRLQIHEGLRGPRPGSLPAFRSGPWTQGARDVRFARGDREAPPPGTRGHSKGPGRAWWKPIPHPCPLHLGCLWGSPEGHGGRPGREPPSLIPWLPESRRVLNLGVRSEEGSLSKRSATMIHVDCGVVGGIGPTPLCPLPATYLGRPQPWALRWPPRQACRERRRKPLNRSPGALRTTETLLFLPAGLRRAQV